MKTLRTASLFSGIGTQEIALDKFCKKYHIRHVPMFFSEVDYNAIEVYKLIHGNITNIGDITQYGTSLNNLNIKSLRKYVNKIDLITCSFPCQSFSIAGKMKGTCDSRGKLIWYALNVINYIKPRYVILENVKNIQKFKSFVKRIETNLTSSGFKTTSFILDAANYGSAQHRERWFMVGTRPHKKVDIPPIVHKSRLVSDVIDFNYKPRVVPTPLIPYMDVKYFKEYNSSYGIVKLFDGHEMGLMKHGFTTNRIYSIYGKSPTLTTSNDAVYYEIGGKLNGLERWRLMGCPVSLYHKVIRHIPNVNINKLTGNAISVECIYALFESVLC